MIFVSNLDEFKERACHAYRAGEYFIDSCCNVIVVPDDDKQISELIQENDGLYYAVNWEDPDLFAEDGTRIPSVY